MKKIGIILLVVLFLCGCSKNEITMKINKNKSMTATILLVTEKNKTDEVKAIQDKLKIFVDNIESYKEKEIYINEYTDADYYGITITKKISDIDSISNKIDVENNLYNLFNDNSRTQYYFTIDKDFLENNYKLKLYYNYNELSSYLDIIKNTFELEDISNIVDFNNIKFTLELPYESLSNNADNVSNDKLRLSWNLDQSKTIEAEFKLYNLNHVRALQFLIVAICLMFISSFFNNNTKKKKAVETTEEIKKEEKEELNINNSELSI